MAAVHNCSQSSFREVTFQQKIALLFSVCSKPRNPSDDPGNVLSLLLFLCAIVFSLCTASDNKQYYVAITSTHVAAALTEKTNGQIATEL